MATDNEIKASVVAKMHRKGHYDPRGVKVDVAAQFGVPSHDRGRAKDLINAMAKNEACPVVYKPKSGKQAVMLEQDSRGWVANWIARHDESALPWDLK
jgi:hypothetical protein